MNLSDNFALLFVALSCILSYTNAQFRVIPPGRSVPIAERPYLVAIFKQENYRCVGSLLTMKFVLTAFKCVFEQSLDEITVKAGVTKLSDSGQVGHPSRFIYTEKARLLKFDLQPGIIELQTPFTKSDTVKTIKLCHFTLNEGKNMEISGWGTKSITECPDELRTTVATIAPWSECFSSLMHLPVDPTYNPICVEDPENGAGYGDSGAPGVFGGEVCAIAIEVFHKDLPPVYLDLSCNSDARFYIWSKTECE